MVVKPCFSPLILDDVKTQIHVINNNQKIAFFFELDAAASILLVEQAFVCPAAAIHECVQNSTDFDPDMGFQVC